MASATNRSAIARGSGASTHRKTTIVRGARIETLEEGRPLVSARALELKNVIGCPYRNIDLDIDQGEVFALRGRNGSGKTALLLTLAARMRPTAGTLEIMGRRMPKAAADVRRSIGLALFEGLNDLSDAERVADATAAEFELYGRRPNRDDSISYLQEWDLDDLASSRVGDLSRKQLVVLGIALAWVGHPALIVVDDIESQLTKKQSVEVMQLLLSFSRERNVAFALGVLERDLARMADNALYLGEER